MMKRMSRREFEQAVREALQSVPQEFAPYLEQVIVEVEDAPTAEEARSVGVDDPGELLGLYHGTPLTERSVESLPALPDRVVIYQRNLEQFCETREELLDEIQATVLHEIGHHFGLDEEELDDLGYG